MKTCVNMIHVVSNCYSYFIHISGPQQWCVIMCFSHVGLKKKSNGKFDCLVVIHWCTPPFKQQRKTNNRRLKTAEASASGWKLHREVQDVCVWHPRVTFYNFIPGWNQPAADVAKTFHVKFIVYSFWRKTLGFLWQQLLSVFVSD